MSMPDWFPVHCVFQSHGQAATPPCGGCVYCLANAEIERLTEENLDLRSKVTPLERIAEAVEGISWAMTAIVHRGGE